MRIRPVLLVLLVLALALPMRLHGLMMPNAEATPLALAEAHPPCHGETTNGESTDGNASHGDTGLGDHHRPQGSAGHASLHCATAGLAVAVRFVEVPLPQGLVLEAMRPRETSLGEGLAPPRQERPPRAFS